MHLALQNIATAVFILTGLLAADPPAPVQLPPLKVCATVSDLGQLIEEIGGVEVEVTVFTPPVGDPHFQEPRPSFIKAMSQADLFVLVGLDLESGWAPALWRGARNPRVLPGGAGFLDASVVIQPLEIPTATSDRSMGDVHPYGNPHYLLDPLNGLRVAGAIAEALWKIRPERKPYFEERSADFRRRLGAALVGEKLAKRYDFQKLVILQERGKLMEFLKAQGDEGMLEGWLARMAPFVHAKVVGDHSMWPYFARRFGVEVVGYMEPRPGIPPSTRHLRELVATMQSLGVKAILASPYYDMKHAEFLAANTGARIARMAHQVGSRKGAETYIAGVDLNVRELVSALETGR